MYPICTGMHSLKLQISVLWKKQNKNNNNKQKQTKKKQKKKTLITITLHICTICILNILHMYIICMDKRSLQVANILIKKTYPAYTAHVHNLYGHAQSARSN